MRALSASALLSLVVALPMGATPPFAVTPVAEAARPATPTPNRAVVPAAFYTPFISLSTTEVEFVVDEDDDPEDQTVRLQNLGTGTLNWEASVDVDWLEVKPDDGKLSFLEAKDLKLEVDSEDLEPGEYQATVTIRGNASNSPQTIDVRLSVLAGPTIGLSPTSLTFDVAEGENPADQNVTITNTGGGTLDWKAEDDASWLSVTPKSGSLSAGISQVVRASVASDDLDPGEYSATITIKGNGRNAPQTVDVTLTVVGHPIIGLSTSQLSFSAEEGSDPIDQVVTITNTGGGTLDWVVSDGAAWLSAAPTSGSLAAGASQDVTVSVETAGLAPGAYAATLTFDGNAENAPQTVAVDLTIAQRPALAVAPTNLDFAVQEGDDPPDRVVTVTNSGGGTLNWTVSDDADWLSAAPSSGSLTAGESADVGVSVIAAPLAPGAYTATLTFDGNGANAPQTVAVSLTVTDRPALTVTPVSLEFGVEEGNDPPEQVVTVANTGGGMLGWDASGDAEWLSVEPMSGSLAGGASQDVTVSVVAADLASGDYTGTLTFDGNGANAPQAVTVSLTVTPPPTIGVSATSLDFVADEGDDPAGEAVTVTNQGGGTLDWQASVDAPWLSVSPASGSLAAGSSQEVTVSATTEELGPGMHTATVTLTGGTASRTIDVGLEVRLTVSMDQLVRALAGDPVLDASQISFLDAMGNGNGRFDLGDFLAWLEGRETGGTP